MYDELDYLTPQLLNDIETKVVGAYTKYQDLVSFQYTSKEWVDNEFVYVDDIKNIEEGIDVLGKYFGYPTGWKTKREWNLTSANSISYIDINRWLNNLDIILNSTFNPLVPRETLYPSDGYLYPMTNLYPNTNLYGNPLVPTNNIKESDNNGLSKN